MKIQNVIQLIGNSLAITLKVIISTTILICFSNCNPEIIIENPYEKIDWQEYDRFKADLHAHTSRSDGLFSPHVVVDRYHDLGYKILAIADHNMVTYPWQEFSSFEASSRTFRRLDEGELDGLPHEDIFVYKNREPNSMGMVAVQANEISQKHHIGSYFNHITDHEDRSRDVGTEAEMLEAIAEENGLAVLFHPGRYNNPVEWYVELFQDHDNLLGMEVYNQGLNHQPGNFHKWDSSLIQLMPDRPVWGFSNDDFHGVGGYTVMGTTWNVFLLPELSVGEVRNAMENGLFYFVYAPEGHDGPSPPEINSVEVNSRKGTIHIEASHYQYIEWVSNGRVVYVGDKINLFDLPEIGSYIRANIYQSKYGTVIHSQAFGVKKL